MHISKGPRGLSLSYTPSQEHVATLPSTTILALGALCACQESTPLHQNPIQHLHPSHINSPLTHNYTMDYNMVGDKGDKDVNGRKGGESETKEQQTANNDNKGKAKGFRELLSDMLVQFPETCASECNPDWCEKRDCNTQKGISELKRFEDTQKSRFKRHLENISKRTNNDDGNFLHVMVQSWSGTRKEKRLLNWMLQQKEYQSLLTQEDERFQYTPMHHALVSRKEDFVNGVLEVEELDFLEILDKKCSRGNCLHLATTHSFSNLSNIIEKCRANKTIFKGDPKSPEDTPLHIAIRSFLTLASSQSSDDDYDPVPDSQQTHEDQNLNSHNEDSDDGYSALDPQERKEEEREKLLIKRILDGLDKDIYRPRPPSMTQDAKSDENMSSISQDTLTREPMELPIGHRVRLLVEACPEALATKNKAKRTPYQEREHFLRNNRLVEEAIKEEYAEKGDHSDTEEVFEARAKRIIIVKDPIAHYIRSFCLHKCKSRDETMKRLYKPGQGEYSNYRVVDYY